MKKTFRVAPALCTALVLCVAGCSGQGGGGGGGSSTSATKTQNDPLEGCPKGASDEYKAGWAETVASVYQTHDLLLDLRRKVDAEGFAEKALQSQMKDFHRGVEESLQRYREAARLTEQDYQRGLADGLDYARRRIIKTRY